MVLRVLTRRSARLVVPALALLAGASGTAAVAAPISAGQAPAQVHGGPAAFGWHTFTLKNGWKSASTAKASTGTPAWALHSGVVYLRGMIKQTRLGGASTFADLPKAVAPSSDIYLQTDTSGSVPGVLYIGVGGALVAYNGNAQTAFSLGGVSYPSTAIKPIPVTLQNTWASADSSYETGIPSYAISHGVVYLSGSLLSTTSPPPINLAFTLPKAARPNQDLYLTVYTFDGDTPGYIQILPTGQVDVSGAGAAAYTTLAGISFPTTAAAWHKFKLVNGWHASSASYLAGAPAYTSVNGVVFTEGAMYQSPAGKLTWTNLPAAARSTDQVKIVADTNTSAVAVIQLSPTEGHVGSTALTSPQSFTSLGGIAYPPSS
jgi:hypothetical protein